MTSHVFRENFVRTNPSYKSSMEFLAYVTCNILLNYYNDGNFVAPEKNYVTKQIVSVFGTENVCVKDIKNFLDKYFTYKGIKRHVYTNKEILSAVKIAQEVVSRSKDLADRSIDDLNQSLDSLLDNDPTNYVDLIIYTVAFDHNKTNQDFDYYTTKIFVALANGVDETMSSIDKKISNIDKDKYGNNVSLYVKDDEILKIFSFLKVVVISDIVLLFSSTLLGSFILHFKKFSMFLDCLNADTFTYKYFYENLLDTFSFLENREEQVFICRYVYNLHYTEICKKIKMTPNGPRMMVQRLEPLLLESINKKNVFYIILLQDVINGTLDLNNYLEPKINKERLLLVYYLMNVNEYISNSDYVHILNKLSPQSYSNKTYEEFEEYFNEFFANWEYDTLNCNVLYRDLRHKKPELVENLGDSCKDSSSLFNYIKMIHPTEYNYYQPFISKRFDLEISSVSLVYDFLKDKVYFSMTDARPYMDYMDIRREYYQYVLVKACNTHILIGEGEMIRKDNFHIADGDLTDIKNKLLFFTEGGDVLETKSFKSYSLFPKLDYEWNKYLLVGITQTYFSDCLEARKVSNGYRNANYEIRRKQNGKL